MVGGVVKDLKSVLLVVSLVGLLGVGLLVVVGLLGAEESDYFFTALHVP